VIQVKLKQIVTLIPTLFMKGLLLPRVDDFLAFAKSRSPVGFEMPV